MPVWTATEFNSYSSLESWRFKSLTFRIGKAASQFGKHAIAEARFEIAVERRYGFYLWKVFLPLLLMVIVSWSVFWFDPPEVSSQVTIAVTTILTIIAFALAISLTLPRVPYLTFADAFFLTCYIFTFVTMVELTAVHIAYRNEQRKVAARIRHTARWLVPARFRRDQFNPDRAFFDLECAELLFCHPERVCESREPRILNTPRLS